MENRRKMLSACVGKIPPDSFFAGGELIAISASSAVANTVPTIPFSAVSSAGKAVYFFGFSPVGTSAEGNNFCVYKYRNGILTKLMESGCSITVKTVNSQSCFCFTNSNQAKLGLIAALSFSANESSADRLLCKMSMKYYDFPRTWVLNVSPKVQAVQLRLASEHPSPGDIVLFASQWVNSSVPSSNPSDEYFGVYLCDELENKVHLCGDNKLIKQSTTWGAADCTDEELSEYSDFSIYDTANAYGRIYGLSFEQEE